MEVLTCKNSLDKFIRALNSLELLQTFRDDAEFAEECTSPKKESPLTIDEEDCGYTKPVLGDQNDVNNKVLGQTWNVQDDKFEMNVAKIIGHQDPSICTNCVKHHSKVFRPSGTDITSYSSAKAVVLRIVQE